MKKKEVKRLLKLTEKRDNSIEAGFHRSMVKLTGGGKELLNYLNNMKGKEYLMGIVLLEIGKRYFTTKSHSCC
ncbi:MAG: hypothetical protein R3B55_03215 [Candidatus Paceibacterota bacterium]